MSATPEQIAIELDDLVDTQLARFYNDDLRAAAALIRAQAERVRVLEGALRFYANEDNYNDNGAPESGAVRAPVWSRHDFDMLQAELDYGKIALAALRGEA